MPKALQEEPDHIGIWPDQAADQVAVATLEGGSLIDPTLTLAATARKESITRCTAVVELGF